MLQDQLTPGPRTAPAPRLPLTCREKDFGAVWQTALDSESTRAQALSLLPGSWLPWGERAGVLLEGVGLSAVLSGRGHRRQGAVASWGGT